MRRSLAILLLMASPAFAQVPPPAPVPKPNPVASAKVPDGPLYAGDLIVLDGSASAGDSIDWELISPPDVTSFVVDTNGKTVAFANKAPGTYVFRLEALSVIGGKVAKSKQRVAFTTVSATPVPPIPSPDPNPVPPAPVNPPAPAPPSVVGNMRVLLLCETSEPMSAAQRAVIFSTTSVVPYLNSKCLKGSDGRPSWRFWDKDTQLFGDSAEWQDAMAKAKADTVSLPKLVVFAGNNLVGSRMLISEADTLSYLQSLGGK